MSAHKDKKMKVISVVNKKGGVGKTTLAVNVATGFAVNGYRVLVIDLDSQSNITNTLSKVSVHDKNIRSIISDTRNVESIIINSVIEGVDLISAHTHLNDNDVENAQFINELKERLDYDVMVIDNSPSFSDLAFSSLVASDLVMIPVKADLYSTMGVIDVIEGVSSVEQFRALELPYRVVVNGVSKNKGTKNIVADYNNALGDRVFDTTITFDEDISREQQEQSLPIITRRNASYIREDYKRLIIEIAEILDLEVNFEIVSIKKEKRLLTKSDYKKRLSNSINRFEKKVNLSDEDKEIIKEIKLLLEKVGN